MKNYAVSLTIYFSLSVPLLAQVSKPILVEHFTNTRCSVCASQNPSFNAILAQHPEVMRISYHPTSPYANCLLAQHNVAENDARTNFYNLYGSTPRLAINGGTISNNPNPYINPNLFDNYQGQTSSFKLRVDQQKSADSIWIRVVLKAEGAFSGGDLRLYGAVAEDTIFYNSPNGESQHHNVFRKTFFGANGLTFSPPALGDSLVWQAALSRNQAWNFNRIFAYALVQQVTNKAMVQTDFRKPGESTLVTNNSAKKVAQTMWVRWYKGLLEIPALSPETSQLELMDLSGRTLGIAKGNRLSIAGLSGGIYLLRIREKGETMIQKVWLNPGE